MSNLRRAVLEKTLRTPQNLTKKFEVVSFNNSNISSENIAIDLDGTKSRNTPGIPSTSCARTRSCLKGSKENRAPTIPVGEMFEKEENGNCKESEQMKIDGREVQTLTNDNDRKSGEENVLKSGNQAASENIKKDTEDQQMKSNRRETLSKCSRGNLTDIILELEFKYERMLTVFKELRQTLNENPFLQERNELIESKKRAQDSAFKLETEKFKLEESVQKLTEEVDILNNRIAQFEDEKQKVLEQAPQAKLDKSSVPKPWTPKARSKDHRRSMINNTFVAMTNNQSKERLYENFIMEQQDVLNFYSLLTGISIWKDADMGNVDDSDIPEKVEFKCKSQLGTSLDEIQFEMTLQFLTNEISLIPIVPDEKQSIPLYFRELKTFDADEGYKFTKEFLTLAHA